MHVHHNSSQVCSGGSRYIYIHVHHNSGHQVCFVVAVWSLYLISKNQLFVQVFLSFVIYIPAESNNGYGPIMWALRAAWVAFFACRSCGSLCTPAHVLIRFWYHVCLAAAKKCSAVHVDHVFIVISKERACVCVALVCVCVCTCEKFVCFLSSRCILHTSDRASGTNIKMYWCI